MVLQRISSVSTGVAGAPYYTAHYFDFQAGERDLCQSRVADFWNALSAVLVIPMITTVSGVLQDLDTETGEVVDEFVVPDRIIGHDQASGEILPTQVQGLIRWRTSTFVGGRRVQGRTFIPGISESGSTAGIPGQALRTAMLAAVGTVVSAPDGNNPLVVFSRPRSGSGARPGAFAPVTSGTPSTTFSTLRSRAAD